MTDLFHDKADDWDARPIPQQISEGVWSAMEAAVPFGADDTVMDFGAGTGLVAGRIAPRVARIVAVDVSPAMLEQLAAKPELEGKARIVCQNLLDEPLGADERDIDVVVSAMAAHHVDDTAALMTTLFTHLRPGGRLALADLDAEDGTFHPPGIEGVFHEGFERGALQALAEQAGFTDVGFVTATEVHKEGRAYPVFLMTATRP